MVANDCRGAPTLPGTSLVPVSISSLVTEAELASFMWQLNGQDPEEMPWEQIIDKSSDQLSYVSYRRDPRVSASTVLRVDATYCRLRLG